jgi:membrane protease YdiL (CAAX protease family)
MNIAMKRFRIPCPEIARFYGLTFAMSWTFWGLAGFLPVAAPALKIAGAFGPALAALLLVWPDAALRRALLGRLLRWRLPAWVHAYALALPVVGILAALSAVRLMTGSGEIWPEPMPLHLPLLVFIHVLVFSIAGEELGWRGFALPGLVARQGTILASLSLGAVWAFWHAPLFLLPGVFDGAIPPLLFAVQSVASSFTYTHLHLAGGDLLIPAHLFHGSFNTSVGLLPVLPQARAGDVTALAAAVGGLCVVAGATTVLLRRGPR